jgi:NADPH2:quinone reductase
MKNQRIVVRRYGGPEVLEILEEERPVPKRGQVLVRILAAGVSLPDLMMREGIHPETPSLPFTPGWDVVGVVDQLGEGTAELVTGQMVAALPIKGGYSEFIALPGTEWVPVTAGLDAAEAVSVILNYVTAYQMLHRTARVRAGQRVLVHGAAGGVGTALLQLGRLAGLEMFGTCSSRTAGVVSGLGAQPIDYQNQDFVLEIDRLTRDGVDAVFDSLGGDHIWRSCRALRSGGRVVAYGLTASLHGGRLATRPRAGRRRRFRAIGMFAWYTVASRTLPRGRRVVPYSIQWLKRIHPELFRQDLGTLLNLLSQRKIAPLVAQRLPLVAARSAHELLGAGGVAGKLVLVNSPA